jgi:hypothetical protein
MSAPTSPSYNGGMTTATSPTGPQFANAGLFIERLTAGDFNRLALAFEREITVTALLPRGPREFEGQEAVCGAFATWFGGFDEYEMLDASLGQLGSRLQMRWRLHVRGGRLGPDDFVVEQYCYADAGATGRIQHMALVCSGFCKEHGDV